MAAANNTPSQWGSSGVLQVPSCLQFQGAVHVSAAAAGCPERAELADQLLCLSQHMQDWSVSLTHGSLPDQCRQPLLRGSWGLLVMLAAYAGAQPEG